MKKINKKIILIVSMFVVLLTSVVAYAAFTFSTEYNANVNFTEINDGALTTPTSNVQVTFTEPGSSFSFDYKLKNNDSDSRLYYYSFSSTTNVDLANMIYVYENGEYIGVLAEVLESTLKLCDGSYVFGGEEVTDTFTLELHNQATGFTVENPVSFTVSCYLQNPNAQELIFVSSEEELIKAFDDANRKAGKTIILKNDITLTQTVELSNAVNIDVCGNDLITNATVTLGTNAVVEVYDSRANGTVSGSANLVVSDATAFLNPLIPVPNCSITSYNETLLIEAVGKSILGIDSIPCNEDYNILGNYSIYYGVLGFAISSVNGHTITAGVYKASELDANQVLGVEVSTTNESNVYDIKLIGSTSTVFETIINTSLVHLSKFAVINSIQVTTDIFLPTAIREYNATISWWSSDENIFSHDGRLIAGQGNIKLRATIKLYDEVYIKDYYLYVVQEDNLTKLQYLATQVERGITTNDLVIPPMKITSVVTDPTLDDAEIHYLPVAGAINSENPYYYTNWTEGKSLGIVELSYHLENVYYYITNNSETTPSTGSKLIEDELLTESYVYLNQVTFAETALITIRGLFDNGQVEETTITILIELPTAALADEVFDQVQIELNKVDVLKNILDTRAASGVLNEKGDFKLPSKIQSVDVRYEVLPEFEDLYEVASIPDDEGNIAVTFKDLKYLGLTDMAAGIICHIVTIDEEGNPDIVATSGSQNNYIDLSFKVPGAITTENFVSISENKLFDFVKYPDTEAIFYSFKFQTLQQSTATPYYIKTDDDATSKLLVDATIEEVYALPEYILMADIDKTKELKFEYGSSDIIIDHYDLSVYRKLIAWATNVGTPQSIKDNQDLTKFIDTGYQWLTSDGTADLSDSEIAAILSYCERYQGFETYWNEVIKVKDNLLNEKEKNEILELLADDQIYISLLSWIRSDTLMTFVEYLRDNNDKQLQIILANHTDLSSTSELTDEDIANFYNLPEEFMTISNDAMESISNDEERVVVYYVLVNHSEEYQDFYSTWKENISRVDDSSEKVKEIIGITINNDCDSGAMNNNFDACYDPIFASILNWATSYSNNDPTNSSITLLSGLPSISNANYSSIFTETELSIKNYWGFEQVDFIATQKVSTNGISIDEWNIIKKYLRLLNISTVSYTVPDGNNGTTTVDVTFDETTDNVSTNLNSNTNLSNVIITNYSNNWLASVRSLGFTDYFIDALVEAVNKWFLYGNADNYNKLLTWAKADSGDEAISWNTIATNITLDRIDSYRIRDNQSRISYDEYIVLAEYLCQQYLSNLYDIETNTGQITFEHLTLFLKYYTGAVDMSFGNNTFSDAGYKDTLETIEKNYGDINEILANITKFTNATVTDMNIYIDSFDGVEEIRTGNIDISDIKVGMSSTIDNSYTSISLPFHSFGNYEIANTIVNDDEKINVKYENVSGILYHYINANIAKVIGKNDTISFVITNNGTASVSLRIDIGHINEEIFTSTITQATGSTEAESGTELTYNSTNRNATVVVAAGTSIVVNLTFGNIVDSSSYFDNLETIDPNELLAIANKYKGTDVETDIVNLLNESVNAYTISLNANGNYECVANGLDRTLENTEKTDLESALEEILGITDTDKKYMYIPLGQIDSDELKAFEALRYYKDLESLTFRGTSTNYLFDTNVSANSVFDIVSGVTVALKNLTMNYTGLSNIESVDNLTSLEKLDIRYNYEKGSYEGLYDISPLINLNYNYPTGKTLNYLNVYGTDAEFIYSEYIFATLYEANNAAELWYNDNGIEKMYNPGNLSDDQKSAINLCKLLHEIGSITGKVLLLPKKVYADGTGVDIDWNPVKLNGLAKLDKSANIISINNPNVLGEIIISASVTVGDVTYVRYFYIQVGRITLE